jgi:hypothetical protein
MKFRAAKHNSGLRNRVITIIFGVNTGGGNVSDLIAQHASEIWTFLAGLIGGGAAGSLITYRVTRTNRVNGRGSVVDQSGSAAGGDIVGRDKRSQKS